MTILIILILAVGMELGAHFKPQVDAFNAWAKGKIDQMAK